jgi:glucose/arabinose dehydrogenase
MPRLKLSSVLIPALLCTSAAFAAEGPEETPGQQFHLTPADMPPPFATPASQARFEALGRPEGTGLELPDGFEASLFAQNLEHARWMAIAPNGDVFLAQSNVGKITVLRDADGDGRAELIETFDDGFERPHGLTFHDGALYVGERRGIWRIPYADGDLTAGTREMITRPNVFIGGSREGHWTRNLAFDSEGQLYVSVGSADNVEIEPEPRATISRVNEDGTLTTYASGLRNPVGIAFYPGTNDLYTVVNERDGYGDGLVPDYLTLVQEGGFYGWPYSYIGSHPDPEFGTVRPDLVEAAIEPDVLFRSHSAALGLAFYTHDAFPEHYRGGAFVSFHGSWNSLAPTGYKVVYVPFENQRPVGGYENFALGFWLNTSGGADIIGRPVGIVVTPEGDLLIADDVGQAIWRVTYTGD